MGATYTWTKDGNVIGGNTSKITINNTSYAGGVGTYKLKIITLTCKTLRNSVAIDFVSKPIVTNITYQQCDLDTAPFDGFSIFDLKSKENQLANNATDVKVEFFENQQDLNNNKPIINIETYKNTKRKEQKLLVKITNTTTKCFDTGKLTLKVNLTELSTYSDVSISELDKNASNPNAIKSEGSNDGVFDFFLKIDDIIKQSLGALSLTTHSFEFYRTIQDASLQKNQIKKPYDDDLLVGDSDVFVRISTKGINSCESIGKFTLSVKSLPIPKGNTNTIFLCVNNPIDNPQLISVNLNADTGITGDVYKWFLNGKLIIGENKAVYKATQKGVYKVFAIRNYLNAKKPSKGYNAFTIKLSNKAIITKINSIDDFDNSQSNQLKIKVSGVGNYEYAINNLNDSSSDFTSGDDNFSHTFTKIKPGIHVISVRDKNGCGIVKSKEITSIHFRRFFIPNERWVF